MIPVPSTTPTHRPRAIGAFEEVPFPAAGATDLNRMLQHVYPTVETLPDDLRALIDRIR